MIKISNLKKSFGNAQILKDINLNIEKNEFCVLLGASGSGKTTLLKILSGHSSFDSGEVGIDGVKFKGQIASHKSRQIITQNYSLMPWMNAINNIKFALKCSGIKDKNELKKTAQKFLNLVHLGGKESLYPHSLSGGQQQRVAIARALSLNPKVLFLDEPFSALDPITRANLQTELKNIATNSTVIFVTHDIDEALFLGDKIVVLHSGAIIKEIKNPRFQPNHAKYFEIKAEIFRLINGEDNQIEYQI
ncbi:nitrate/sulfonate/bicarbonate ABC transporter, ATP-binding protein [Campylobacter iguaniorum]|uniref:ABC transporter ATP-binding protein n=1 Tax=Campylobacter iguaniorum TaxID=1244531 RepID=UPI0007C8B59E|nr:ABC transporter ATP-binding protein [Campylobacter iguaniorum]ANE35713.1 nitrate/sulfonate/bicarbonate ABC transporter, ATP-binding protein [Campylobacter iguaniorum]